MEALKEEELMASVSEVGFKVRGKVSVAGEPPRTDLRANGYRISKVAGILETKEVGTEGISSRFKRAGKERKHSRVEVNLIVKVRASILT